MNQAGWLGRYLWSGWAGLAGFFCLFAAWEYGHEIYGAFVLPAPLQTFHALIALVQRDELRDAVILTGERTGLSFAASAIIGSLAGAFAGYSFAAMRLFKPVIAFFLGVPPIAWIVLALIWFGTGGGSAVATAIVASLPLSFIGALEGVATRDRALEDMARVFGAGPLRRFWSVTAPHLLSYLFAAWTMTVGTAWKVTVMAELLANAGGIGGLLASARALFDIAEVTALTLLVVILALLSEYAVLQPLREWCEGWRRAGQVWGLRP